MDDTDWMLAVRAGAGPARSLEPDCPSVKFMTTTIQYVNRQWSEVEKTMNGGAGLEVEFGFRSDVRLDRIPDEGGPHP